MEIVQLTQISLQDLTETVNESFSDYTVKISLTQRQMKEKLMGVRANLDYSFGAIDNGKLVGFIINAINDSLAYDVMTGVIPEYRGKGVFTQLFEATLSYFGQYGIDTYQLEVIKTNEKALSLYTRNGFEKTVSYTCFQGRSVLPFDNSQTVLESSTLHPTDLEHLWLTEPSYSNLHFNKSEHTTYTLQNENNTTAFVTVSKSGGVRHFGAENYDDLRQLFAKLSLIFDHLVINNVDDRDTDLIQMFIDSGFSNPLGQYQMELKL